MSGVATYVVVCDRCGCQAPVAERPPRRLHSVRADLGLEGWTHRIDPVPHGVAPSLDFCPACSAAPEEDKAA